MLYLNSISLFEVLITKNNTMNINNAFKIQYLALIMLILMPSAAIFAQQQQQNILEQPVPRDEKVITGVLPNGMTYYIVHNEEPKDRASFYMIQNVGALLENDKQDGLAHFLEHMAFNGTEHFPGKGIIDGLEKYGVKFGQNINAYTAYNETVYNISEVPSDKPEAMDMCLMVLNDWSNYLLLTDEELDSERGVISEEWRTRRNASFRMRSISNPVMTKGSMYEVRDVIGKLDIINGFKPSAIKEFYHDWYRTDLQAIAIVGDFNAAEMQKKVIDLFSKIPAVENPKKRPFFEIPEHDDLRFVVASDKEAVQSSVNMMMIKRNDSPNNIGSLKLDIENALFNQMLQSRVSEKLKKEETACLGGGGGIYENFKRGYDLFYVQAASKPNEEADAFKVIFTEVERIKQHGFLLSELDRAKLDLDSYFETTYNSRDKISNDAIASDIKNDYLNGEVITSPEFDYQLGKGLLQMITVEDMNNLVEQWLGTIKNATVYVNGPSEGVTHTNREEISKVISDLEKSKLELYVDASAGLKLIDSETVIGAKVVSEKNIEKFDAQEWKLPNGATVIFKHADYNKDNISISAWSKGGTSIYDNDKIISATNTVGFVKGYGVSDYDATTLGKLMAGKNASVSPYISGLEEGFNGSASIKDFEVMMQLLYLKFEKPRFDENAYNLTLVKTKASIEAAKNNPMKIRGDSITATISNYNERVKIQNEDYVKAINFEEMNEIYKDRFSNASDFTFLIVGNMTAEEVKPMVEKYIGALSDNGRSEKWIDRKVRGPKGETHKRWFFPLETPKGTVLVKYDKKLKYSPKNDLELEFVKSVLDFRFTTEIRENEGGTYGVGVYAISKKDPVNKYSIIYQFDSDAEKTDHLLNRCNEVIADFVKNGPTEEELNKVKQNVLKNRVQSKEHNSYWSNVIKAYFVEGIDNNDAKNYEDIVNNMTAKHVKKMASKIFEKSDLVEMVVLPKEMEK